MTRKRTMMTKVITISKPLRNTMQTQLQKLIVRSITSCSAIIWRTLGDAKWKDKSSFTPSTSEKFTITWILKEKMKTLSHCCRMEDCRFGRNGPSLYWTRSQCDQGQLEVTIGPWQIFWIRWLPRRKQAPWISQLSRWHLKPTQKRCKEIQKYKLIHQLGVHTS